MNKKKNKQTNRIYRLPSLMQDVDVRELTVDDYTILVTKEGSLVIKGENADMLVVHGFDEDEIVTSAGGVCHGKVLKVNRSVFSYPKVKFALVGFLSITKKYRDFDKMVADLFRRDASGRETDSASESTHNNAESSDAEKSRQVSSAKSKKKPTGKKVRSKNFKKKKKKKKKKKMEPASYEHVLSSFRAQQSGSKTGKGKAAGTKKRKTKEPPISDDDVELAPPLPKITPRGFSLRQRAVSASEQQATGSGCASDSEEPLDDGAMPQDDDDDYEC
jgi:hypothetical protein